jgi:hypothetical protein
LKEIDLNWLIKISCNEELEAGEEGAHYVNVRDGNNDLVSEYDF